MNKLQRLIAQAVIAGLLLGSFGFSLLTNMTFSDPTVFGLRVFVGLIFALVMLVLVIIQTIQFDRPPQ